MQDACAILYLYVYNIFIYIHTYYIMYIYIYYVPLPKSLAHHHEEPGQRIVELVIIAAIARDGTSLAIQLHFNQQPFSHILTILEAVLMQVS